MITSLEGNPLISFPKSGSIYSTFKWTDKRTLTQIEKLKGYSVMPRGILSMCKNGVFLITEKDGTVYSRSY